MLFISTAKAMKEVNTARKPIIEPMAITFAPIAPLIPERASTVVSEPLTPKTEKNKNGVSNDR